MPLIPIPYADLVIALVTIAIGILGQPHYVSRSSIWANIAFFVATWLTTEISLEFTILLILYLLLAFVVVRRPKPSDLGEKKRQNMIAFLFLGSRGYGSMLLSMALFELGYLELVSIVPLVSSLVSLGSLGYVLGGWLLILVAVHLAGFILKGPP
jgi:hypothetical protein